MRLQKRPAVGDRRVTGGQLQRRNQKIQIFFYPRRPEPFNIAVPAADRVKKRVDRFGDCSNHIDRAVPALFPIAKSVNDIGIVLIDDGNQAGGNDGSVFSNCLFFQRRRGDKRLDGRTGRILPGKRPVEKWPLGIAFKIGIGLYRRGGGKYIIVVRGQTDQRQNSASLGIKRDGRGTVGRRRVFQLKSQRFGNLFLQTGVNRQHGVVP